MTSRKVPLTLAQLNTQIAKLTKEREDLLRYEFEQLLKQEGAGPHKSTNDARLEDQCIDAYEDAYVQTAWVWYVHASVDTKWWY